MMFVCEEVKEGVLPPAQHLRDAFGEFSVLGKNQIKQIKQTPSYSSNNKALTSHRDSRMLRALQ